MEEQAIRLEREHEKLIHMIHRKMRLHLDYTELLNQLRAVSAELEMISWLQFEEMQGV